MQPPEYVVIKDFGTAKQELYPLGVKTAKNAARMACRIAEAEKNPASRYTFWRFEDLTPSAQDAILATA